MLTLIKTERQKFVRYVRSLLQETAGLDAEDVVQDVMLRMIERASTNGPVENITAYMYRSLKNQVIDYTRTQKPTVSLDNNLDGSGESLASLLEDHQPNALELLNTEQGKQELFAALECLNEIEKQVVIAHELEGNPFKELANAWDIPQNTLLSHKSRAMKKLRIHFSH